MSDLNAPGHDGLVDELRDPLAALPRYFGEAEYDPRSLRPIVGPVITTARRGALGLVRRWLLVTVQRQDRINRLVTRMLELLDQRSAPQLDHRLLAVEETLRADQSAAQVADLELTALAHSLGLADELASVDLAPLAAAFSGATDVVAFGSATLARALGTTLVDDVQQRAEFHLRQAGDATLGGIAAFGLAERLAPGHLLVVLRQVRRALRSGGTVALITLDPRDDAFWVDPRRSRPAPRALLLAMLAAADLSDARVIELGDRFAAVIARRA